MAGPFETADFARLIPADKKLDPTWVKSLFARGEREVYRGAELEKIGMPVGGICAGQLYLGGDGTLWHWDIFNQIIGTGDGNYAHPPNPDRPLNQGFAIRTKIGEKAEVRKLDRSGFADVTFCGEYPIATVEYRDPKSPVVRVAGSLFAIHSARSRQLQLAGDPHAVHGHEPRQRARGC